MIILYAEDDPEDADLFCEVVRSISSKIACIIAKDGIDALEILENSTVLPDFIFLDVNMPLLDGKECLMRIKRNKEFRAIPVVIYTTSKRQKDIQTFKELGAFEYIIKPNSVRDAYKSLKNVLSRDRT
jgi:CheY-like chemotaxis protein